MTSVWPALWPPWKRTTISARSDSQSTILPLPSSPHWAPTTVTLAISLLHFLRRTVGEHMRAAEALGLARRRAVVETHQRDPALLTPLLRVRRRRVGRQEETLRRRRLGQGAED